MPRTQGDYRVARAVLSAPYPLPVIITRNPHARYPGPSLGVPYRAPNGSIHFFPQPPFFTQHTQPNGQAPHPTAGAQQSIWTLPLPVPLAVPADPPSVQDEATQRAAQQLYEYLRPPIGQDVNGHVESADMEVVREIGRLGGVQSTENNHRPTPLNLLTSTFQTVLPRALLEWRQTENVTANTSFFTGNTGGPSPTTPSANGEAQVTSDLYAATLPHTFPDPPSSFSPPTRLAPVEHEAESTPKRPLMRPRHVARKMYETSGDEDSGWGSDDTARPTPNSTKLQTPPTPRLSHAQHTPSQAPKHASPHSPVLPKRDKGKGRAIPLAQQATSPLHIPVSKKIRRPSTTRNGPLFLGGTGMSPFTYTPPSRSRKGRRSGKNWRTMADDSSADDVEGSDSSESMFPFYRAGGERVEVGGGGSGVFGESGRIKSGARRVKGMPGGRMTTAGGNGMVQAGNGIQPGPPIEGASTMVREPLMQGQTIPLTSHAPMMNGTYANPTTSTYWQPASEMHTFTNKPDQINNGFDQHNPSTLTGHPLPQYPSEPPQQQHPVDTSHYPPSHRRPDLPLAKACHNFLLARKVQAARKRRLASEAKRRQRTVHAAPSHPLTVRHDIADEDMSSNPSNLGDQTEGMMVDTPAQPTFPAGMQSIAVGQGGEYGQSWARNQGFDGTWNGNTGGNGNASTFQPRNDIIRSVANLAYVDESRPPRKRRRSISPNSEYRMAPPSRFLTSQNSTVRPKPVSSGMGTFGATQATPTRQAERGDKTSRPGQNTLLPSVEIISTGGSGSATVRGDVSSHLVKHNHRSPKHANGRSHAVRIHSEHGAFESPMDRVEAMQRKSLEMEREMRTSEWLEGVREGDRWKGRVGGYGRKNGEKARRGK